VVFGLLHLLGLQYRPALPDLPDQRLWRTERAADYGALNHAARGQVDLARLRRHWPDILRVVASIYTGTVSAYDVVRMLQRDGHPTPLGDAIAGYRRIFKSLHVLAYLDDETYRRDIKAIRNLQEGRHSLAARLFHGRKGELYQRYHTGMEDQLGGAGAGAQLRGAVLSGAALDRLSRGMSMPFATPRVVRGRSIRGGSGTDHDDGWGWVVGTCRAQRLALQGGERSWTVLGRDHRPVAPAEEYLEYLRVQRVSPNTVKSYARALALWWEYLAVFGLGWDTVTVEDFGGFLTWLRTGDGPELVSIQPRPARFAESTVAVRLRAVLACYTYHQLNGVDVGRDLYRITHRRGGNYKPLLEHVARRKGRRQAVIRVRQRRGAAPPTLTPGQIARICDACATWDAAAGRWRGSVRNRLLWALLADTGLRLGEALGLQHRDWHTGRGDTPSSRSSPAITPTTCAPRAATGACTSPMAWTASTASTSGSCARPAPTWPPTTWTPRTCSSTSTVSPGLCPGGRTASTTWSTGCAAGLPGRSRRAGRRTGFGTRTRPRCCCAGCRCTWSAAGSATATCRPR
jgi:site-specific recombinase XerD